MFLIRQYKNKCLCVTGGNFIVPLLWGYRTLPQHTILEKILGMYCIILCISTILFWNKPIRGSLIHKIDAIIAKSCFVYYVSYTYSHVSCIKEIPYLLSYNICIGGMVTTFYYSRVASTKEWCSDEHIYYHGLLHLFAFGLALHAYL